jgi:hypothetical protein
VVNLLHCLPDQEQTADEEHEILPAEAQFSLYARIGGIVGWALFKRPWNREQRLLHAENEAQQSQKNETRDHRENQSSPARLRPFLRGKFAGEDGNEDDIVHSQHHFQRHEGEKRNPCGTLGDPCEIGELIQEVHKCVRKRSVLPS